MRRLATSAFAARASVLVLGFLASATSLVNGFVYDDRPIVSTNPRVHTLARWWEAFAQPYWPPDWGDTNYRPLTILSFAVQWAIGDGSPVVFHATSVALYLGACLAVLRLAQIVLPASAAWLAAALFAVHPVHVEAVGNVVGQAELVVAICTTLAVAAYVRARTGNLRLGAVAGIAALYAIACFSKETGFFLPGLLLAAECTVVATALDPARQNLRARARELWTVYAACAVVGVGYLAVRRSVLGGFGDDPNTVIALLDHKARLLTMIGVVPEWARLLLWPARLAADYSPADVPVIMGFAPAAIPGLLILIGFAVLCAAGWTGARVATFGLLWLAVAIFPVSNVVLRSGVIVAERTLFLPSIGALLAVGAAATWAGRRASAMGFAWQRPAAVTVAVLLALGVVKSASRQRVWRTSDDFLSSIVEDAPRSYRAHYMHGMWHFENGRREHGERHVRMAIALFPYDAGPYTDLGDQYRKAGLCAPARDLYRRAIALGVLRDRARLGLVACFLRDAHWADAQREAKIGVAGGGREVHQFRRLLAVADSAADATGGIRQAGRATVWTPPKQGDPRP
ncbi:MAG: hypothetical protein M3303_00970 [Gemmatimonadota bacterium]|nr:hypothetical protein [Gemmatimonadota bacterium]